MKCPDCGSCNLTQDEAVIDLYDEREPNGHLQTVEKFMVCEDCEHIEYGDNFEVVNYSGSLAGHTDY